MKTREQDGCELVVEHINCVGGIHKKWRFFSSDDWYFVVYTGSGRMPHVYDTKEQAEHARANLLKLITSIK